MPDLSLKRPQCQGGPCFCGVAVSAEKWVSINGISQGPEGEKVARREMREGGGTGERGRGSTRKTYRRSMDAIALCIPLDREREEVKSVIGGRTQFLFK